jgi:hypothetical protein
VAIVRFQETLVFICAGFSVARESSVAGARIRLRCVRAGRVRSTVVTVSFSGTLILLLGTSDSITPMIRIASTLPRANGVGTRSKFVTVVGLIGTLVHSGVSAAGTFERSKRIQTTRTGTAVIRVKVAFVNVDTQARSGRPIRTKSGISVSPITIAQVSSDIILGLADTLAGCGSLIFETGGARKGTTRHIVAVHRARPTICYGCLVIFKAKQFGSKKRAA